VRAEQQHSSRFPQTLRLERTGSQWDTYACQNASCHQSCQQRFAVRGCCRWRTIDFWRRGWGF